MDRIRILLADDHPLIRNGLTNLLQDIEDFQIVGEAEDGQQVIEKTGELSPDLVILDISMPKLSGIEVAKIIKQQFPNTRILILSMHDEEEYALQSLKFGADGYVVKKSGKDELISAIRAVSAGKEFYSPDISRKLVKKYLTLLKTDQDKINKESIPLTKREKEILKLIAAGLTAKEISDKLFISHRTVDTHRTNLMRKLDIRNTAGLVRFAIEKKQSIRTK